jgi:photosystem II stability/assembly factor-like uncharacterized protein
MPISDWAVRGALPARNFKPEGVRVLGPQRAVLAGYLDEGKLEKNQAVIYLVDQGGARQVHSEQGWIEALDVAGSVAFAVHAILKPDGSGSQYGLRKSLDGGATWSLAGPIPAPSVTQILAVSAQEAWVLGEGVLMQTTDAGSSWYPVNAPGERNSVVERLARVGEAVLILGDGVLATRDGGNSWEQRGFDGLRVGAVSGGMVAAYSPTEVRLGLINEGGGTWYASFAKKMVPFRLLAEGDSAWMLALPMGEGSGERIGSGVLLYETQDRGKSWQSVLIRCSPREEAIDIGPDGSALAVAPEAQLLSPK